MKTFYSIISVVINPITSDKIATGLLLSDGQNSLYTYSGNRLSFIKSLVSKEQFSFIKDYLKSFNEIIEKIDTNPEEQMAFDYADDKLIINEPYFEYMSVYGHNVVTASKPVQIDVSVNKNNFNQLFQKFIGKEVKIPSKDKKNIIEVKDNFTTSVTEYFSIEKELTSENYPNLIFPVTMDLFGKNENYVIGQFIDLERQLNYIKNDYFDLEKIDEAIADNQSIKYFISSEPDKKVYTHQHQLWQYIRKHSKFTYVDISEVDKIKEYAKKHDVKPC